MKRLYYIFTIDDCTMPGSIFCESRLFVNETNEQVFRAYMRHYFPSRKNIRLVLPSCIAKLYSREEIGLLNGGGTLFWRK